MPHPPPTQSSNKPWSGANPIPNIQQFVAKLDKEKAARDKQIDEDNAAAQQDPTIIAHQNQPHKKGTTVTDPVTGKQVVIADVGKEMMKNVDNPTVRLYHQPL
jgi:uncharacterized membrane protein YdfJ with MMPL/SSD domain